MAPVVVLKMDMHCGRCARRIQKFVKSLPGVQDLWVSPGTGTVVVAGPCLDASLLQSWIQARTGRPVDVVSDGAPDAAQMLPTPEYTYPYPYPGCYGGVGYQQYVPNEAPVCFNDDNPNGCCVMQ